MSLFGALVVFIIAWWMVFFMTLPFGVNTPETPGPGHADSAPDRPCLWLKASITTAITAALTGLAAVAVEYGSINFREMVE